jgi:hypothetical protein
MSVVPDSDTMALEEAAELASPVIVSTGGKKSERPEAEAAGDQLGPWTWQPITFSGGVPVGGWAQLTLHRNGAYNFSGHFHDSGFPPYKDALVWVVKDSKNVAYVFRHRGHMGGTIGGGSRDDDWNQSGRHDALAAGWNDLLRHWQYKASAAANLDIGPVFDIVMKGIGVVASVIAIV